MHNDLCGYHTEFSKEAHELVGDCVWMIQQAQDFATGERTKVIRMQEMGCGYERQEWAWGFDFYSKYFNSNTLPSLVIIKLN